MRACGQLTFLFILLQGLLPAPASAQLLPAPAVCTDPGSSLLWQVSSAESANEKPTLHLFGSIHVGQASFYPLHPRIETLFRSADHLVFEIDPVAAANPQTALRMQMRGMLPAGQTLADLVDPEVLQRLRTHTERLGLPMTGLMNLKPWLLTLLLANFEANALGYDAANGLESYLIAQKPAQTLIHELESLDQQLDMLDSLDPALFLDYSLDEFDSAASGLETLVQAWRCADKEALATQLFAALEEDSGDPQQEAALDGLYNKLFTGRNVTMADGIENFLRTGSGSWFVVVGSAHLLGEGSVVDLLEQRGYRVMPVRLD